MSLIDTIRPIPKAELKRRLITIRMRIELEKQKGIDADQGIIRGMKIYQRELEIEIKNTEENERATN